MARTRLEHDGEPESEGDELMGMLQSCSAAGCETKTLGKYCLEHESRHQAVPARRNEHLGEHDRRAAAA